MTTDRSTTAEQFQFVSGMRIPDLSGTGNSYYTGRGWSTAAISNTGNTTYAVTYFPATFYLPAAAPGGLQDRQCQPATDRRGLWPRRMRRYQIKSGNYSSSAAYNAAIQNFANWFQYHRNRVLAIVGSSTAALVSVDTMRVGYFTINKLSNATMYDMVTNQADLYSQIYGLTASGGTPNRRAVGTWWTSSAVPIAARRSSWPASAMAACCSPTATNSGNTANSGFGDADSVNSTHLPSIPFADGYSNTIADIAAGYAGARTPWHRTGLQVPVVTSAIRWTRAARTGSDWIARPTCTELLRRDPGRARQDLRRQPGRHRRSLQEPAELGRQRQPDKCGRRYCHR